MEDFCDKSALSRVMLQGFKSIAKCEITLGNLNVLIGCNGAGKSNFIHFFDMIAQMLNGHLQLYAGRHGGSDPLLHFGRKRTSQLKTTLHFGNGYYGCILEPTADNHFLFRNEWLHENQSEQKMGEGHFETKMSNANMTKVGRDMLSAMKQWRVYHFHDTSDTAFLKQLHGINDNIYLRPDAKNLAAYLYFLQKKYPENYKRIIKTIRLVAPFFRDFNLRPSPYNEDVIELEWVENGEDIPFKAHHLSDGTLRFICLVTVFLQPEEKQPETIFVDEPELGLHPYALAVLTAIMKSVAQKKQLIVSTQSVELLNEFEAKDVIVVDREEGSSSFRRLDEKGLLEWLKEYSLGELWKKNLLGGRPAR